MKCKHCGTLIPDGELICPKCRRKVQIVPDYNPLEDVLAAEVKGALNNRTTGNFKKLDSERYNTTRNTSRNLNGRTGRLSSEERELRRRQAERKKQLEKKRKKKKMILFGCIACLAIVLGFVAYTTSYSGRVRKGNNLLASNEYSEAIEVFKKAIKKSPKKPDAYEGLAKVYIEQDELEKAEELFLDAIEQYGTEVELYRATIMFYSDTKQVEKIPTLLEKCEDEKVLAELSNFVVEVPTFSLDEKVEYDDVQALRLSSDGGTIYYTTDKSTPTTKSNKYTEAIKIEEGTTEVKAISVNENGIPSMVVSKVYKVQFPMVDAPSVSPSTGQYDEAQMITVVIPDKYEAYYTTDGSDPDPENNPATKKYTGAIKMPEGSNIFSVVLVDAKGRISDITKRNYELIISE